jgi:hypothetical protein
VGRSIRLVMVALVAALALAACGGKDTEEPKAATTDSSSPQVVTDGSLSAGEKVAAPEGEVVLTVTGDIGTANKGRTLEGVLLSDLLAVAGVPDSASKVSLTALDDYKVDFDVADVRSSQMLLATKADGKHMPVDHSGPIRIVFPDSSSLGRNPDLWIWSVSSMKVA